MEIPDHPQTPTPTDRDRRITDRANRSAVANRMLAHYETLASADKLPQGEALRDLLTVYRAALQLHAQIINDELRINMSDHEPEPEA